jgi:hypothetical protein
MSDVQSLPREPTIKEEKMDVAHTKTAEDDDEDVQSVIDLTCHETLDEEEQHDKFVVMRCFIRKLSLIKMAVATDKDDRAIWKMFVAKHILGESVLDKFIKWSEKVGLDGRTMKKLASILNIRCEEHEDTFVWDEM